MFFVKNMWNTKRRELKELIIMPPTDNHSARSVGIFFFSLCIVLFSSNSHDHSGIVRRKEWDESHTSLQYTASVASWSLNLQLQSAPGWTNCLFTRGSRTSLGDFIPFLQFAIQVNHSKEPRNLSPHPLLKNSKKIREFWVQITCAAWPKEKGVSVQQHDLCPPAWRL